MPRTTVKQVVLLLAMPPPSHAALENEIATPSQGGYLPNKSNTVYSSRGNY